MHAVRSGAGHWKSIWRTIAAACLMAAVLGGWAGADDAATASLSTPKLTVTEDLQRIFAGGNPSGIADLKGMQAHVQKLTDQLCKCTVGVEVGQAQGSGVIISKDGYVLTAAHVSGQPNRDVVFYLSEGRTAKGKTLGLYRTLDAGLMKITDEGEYPYAELGASDSIHFGQWCLALGHPGGHQIDRGVVLRLGRVLLADDKAITTDCTLVGGDSGGPLFDMEGRVIGINSRIAERIEANMHVPVNTFKESWERLEKGEAWGHLPGRKPVLGVKGVEGPEAKIAEVYPGSSAERGGLKAGDVILKFAGREITDFASLKAAVDDQQPPPRGGFRRGGFRGGSGGGGGGGRSLPVEVQVKRDGQTLTLSVPLAFRDE